MRQLLPSPADDIDLVTAYAFPDQPWVRANMVASVDGAGAVNGRTKGISGPADEQAFGILRQLADVLLVGAGTVRSEGYGAEPSKPEHIAHRRARGQADAPAIAVVSRSLELDPRSDLFVGAVTRTIVITCAAAPEERRRALDEVADVIDAGEDRVDLDLALDALVARGLHRVSCEGGPRLLGQLVAAGRLDELCFTLAPLLVGDRPPRLLGDQRLPQPLRMQISQLLEDDGFLFGRFLVDHTTSAV